MSTSTDASMLEDLTIDELRWLEASEIIEFPTSPTDSFHLNDSVITGSSRLSRLRIDSQRLEARSQPNSAKKSGRLPPIVTPTTSASTSSPSSPASPVRRNGHSRRSTSSSSSASHSLPSRTPSRREGPHKNQVSPSEWIYRRPKAPITPRTAPSTSALSSSLSISQPLPSTPMISRTHSVTSTRTARASDESEASDSSPSPRRKQSNNPAFWSTILRPRSRSVRSIPLLKTIPSQSQITLHSEPQRHPGPSPISSSNSSSSISHPNTPRPPSITSTLSSASSHSSSRPETPSSPSSTLPDPFFSKPNRAYRRHHTPQSSHDARLPPLSTSCPSKSILTRTSSISTKDSAIANKSVKFVEIPTVHYASAGYWNVETVDRMDAPDGREVDVMGIDVDSMDMDSSFSYDKPRRKRPYASSGALSRTDLHELSEGAEPDTPDTLEESRDKVRGLRRLMSLSRKASPLSKQVSAAARREDKAKAKTSRIISSPTALQPASPPPRPSISGPYALGAHPLPPLPASPAMSTTSLRSTTSSRSRVRSKSQASQLPSHSHLAHPHSHSHSLHPLSQSQPSPHAIPSSYPAASSTLHTGPSLENYRSGKNPAARSVRSLVSVKSTSSTTAKFSSWFGRWGSANT